MEESLVLEMQRLAMDSKARVTDVIRAALVVATKLDIPEFREWCEGELSGSFGKQVPEYRRVRGEIKAWNPVLRQYIPVMMGGNPSLYESLSTKVTTQSIGEIEELHDKTDGGGVLQMPFSPEVMDKFFRNTEEYHLGIIPTVLIGPTHLLKILEAVRNTVLNWSLRLERDGILGRGLTFSPDEKRTAEHVTYKIEQFTGVLGSVHATSFQLGDYNTIHAELKRLGVPQRERNDIEEILDRLPKADAKTKKSLITRGGDWLKRNASTIGTLSETIRTWLETFK